MLVLTERRTQFSATRPTATASPSPSHRWQHPHYDWMVPVLGHRVGTGAPGGLSQRLQLILVLLAQGKLVNSIPSGGSPTPAGKSGPHTCSEAVKDTGHSTHRPWQTTVQLSTMSHGGEGGTAARELSHEKVTQVDVSYSSLSHKGP